MKMYKTGLFFIFSCLLGLTACTKEKNEATTTKPQPASLTSQIDGYKNFKFGMLASDVVKQPECIEGYKQSIQFKKNALIYNVGAQNKASKSKYKEDLKNLETFSMDSLNCSIDFMGYKNDILLMFKNTLLASAEITINGFDNAQYQAINKYLYEKYSVKHIPTEEQISAFNNGNGPEQLLSSSYAENQVVLTASKISSGNISINGISIKYLNPSLASEINKEVMSGQVKASDL